MALLATAILPSHTSCLALRSFCQPSPSIGLSHSQLRLPFHSSKTVLQIRYQPRVSPSGGDPQPSDSEDPFQNSKEYPEEEGPANFAGDPTIDNDPNLNSAAVSSGPSSPSGGAPDSNSASSSSPINNVAALQLEKDRQQEDLRATLDALSRSLELLSSTLSEISSAVRVLSSALGNSQLQVGSSATAAGYSYPTELKDVREAGARRRRSDPPEPWDNAVTAAPGIGASGGTVDVDIQRIEQVPPYLVEQNERAHRLAYRLQQAFIQARIEGLGEPFQVAAEDFVQACMEAHDLGFGLKELQLQLVLQDGSLTGAFAIRNQRWSRDPILSEESRIRSLWVRLVYATLAQLGPSDGDEGEMDPIDDFVKQVIQMAFEQGYDLGRLILEQAFAGPDRASGAVKTMRENQYLILLTLQKVKTLNK